MYVAIEIKTKVDGTMEVSTFKKETEDLGKQAFHSIMASAAVSTHPIHTGVLLDEYGNTLRRESYKHEVPVPNEEPKEDGEE